MEIYFRTQNTSKNILFPGEKYIFLYDEHNANSVYIIYYIYYILYIINMITKSYIKNFKSINLLSYYKYNEQ